MSTMSRVNGDTQLLKRMEVRRQKQNRSLALLGLIILPVLGVIAWYIAKMSSIGF